MNNIYTFDPTGTNINNLIVNEVHSVNVGSNTAIVPNAGPYFTNSLVVSITNTNQILVRNVDYITIQLNTELTGKLGQEICNALLFLGTYNASNISLKYQCVGGSSATVIEGYDTLLQNVLNTSQKVQWENILNRPNQFVPNNHVNTLSDIYGFEPVVYAIERIHDLLKLGNDASFQLLMNWVVQYLNRPDNTPELLGLINNLKNALEGQIQNVADAIPDSSPRGNRVLYSLINDASIVFNPYLENNVLGTNLEFNNLPNGFRLYWELESNLNNIGNLYYPNRHYFNVNNIESYFKNFNIQSQNLNNVLIAGLQYIISAIHTYQHGGILIDWYSFSNGLPTFVNCDFSLYYLARYSAASHKRDSRDFYESYFNNRKLTNIQTQVNLFRLTGENILQNTSLLGDVIPFDINRRKLFTGYVSYVLFKTFEYVGFSRTDTANEIIDFYKDNRKDIPGYINTIYLNNILTNGITDQYYNSSIFNSYDRNSRLLCNNYNSPILLFSLTNYFGLDTPVNNSVENYYVHNRKFVNGYINTLLQNKFDDSNVTNPTTNITDLNEDDRYFLDNGSNTLLINTFNKAEISYSLLNSSSLNENDRVLRN